MPIPNVEGEYKVTYVGWFGAGYGRFRLANGKVTGTDAGGGVYHGDYQYNPHTHCVDMDMDLRLLFPNLLVTDGKTRGPDDVSRLRLSLPWHKLGQPVSVNLATGPLMVTVEQVIAAQAVAKVKS